MTDALNQMIHHKCEKTLPCSADADHSVPVLPFSLSAQDNVNKLQVAHHNSRGDQDSRMPLYKCYSKCCLDMLKIFL